MEVIDQFGRKVNVPDDPQRIISLVPSQSEYLADLNLDHRVVGITRFCERPRDWFYKKARVGGTKDPDIERIAALKPDLILGNAEENTRKSVLELERLYPVWLSDVKDLESNRQMMLSIGEMTHRQDLSSDWTQRIDRSFKQEDLPQTGLKVLYLIWRDPWMAAGRDTFINSMIEAAGFENVISDVDSRYPVVTEEQIDEWSPDLIFLSTEPYPFKDEHEAELTRLFGSPAHTVDGALFSWYGSRLVHSPAYFKSLQLRVK